jgi:hypothetical protein
MTFGKRSGAIAAVVTGATLVPLVAFGGVGLAKNSPSGAQYQYPGANQYKVRICHYTHSKKHPWVIINISQNAWPAHQKHGDVLFPTGTTCPAKVTTAAKTHGNSGSNGNNGDNGNHGNGNNGKHGKP